MGRNDRNSRPRTKISEESRVYLDGFLRTNPFFFKNPCLRHGFFFPKIDRAEEDLYIFPVNFHPASERAGQKQNLVRNLSSARLDGVFAAVAARVRGEGAARRDGTAAGVIQKLEINLLAIEGLDIRTLVLIFGLEKAVSPEKRKILGISLKKNRNSRRAPSELGIRGAGGIGRGAWRARLRIHEERTGAWVRGRGRVRAPVLSC